MSTKELKSRLKYFDLNLGDTVEILGTENVRSFNYKGVGFIFTITKKCFDTGDLADVFVAPYNEYSTNYIKGDYKVIKSAKSEYLIFN